MGGHGSFSDPRIGVDVTNGSDDQITAKLPALRAYQLSLNPPPPPGSFDANAAARGKLLFEGAGRCVTCVTCHADPQMTDASSTLHLPSAVASEPEPNGAPSYASRSATGNVARRRCMACGSIRPISIMAARQAPSRRFGPITRSSFWN